MKTAMKQHQVKTSDRHASPTPRLPHERDESDQIEEDTPRDDIKQAFKDLQAGQVDTDLRNTGGVDEAVNNRPGTSPDKVVKKDF
jgi:hypothetical protein